MSTDFPPVEARPDRRIWILIAAGIVCAIVLVWAGRRSAMLSAPSMPAVSDTSRASTADARTKLAEVEPPAAQPIAPPAVAVLTPAQVTTGASTSAAPATAAPAPAIAAGPAAAPVQSPSPGTAVAASAASPAPIAAHAPAADSPFAPGPLPRMQVNDTSAAVASPVAMVPRAELAKETARARAAEKAQAADRSQIEELQKQLAEARAQNAQLTAQLSTPPKSTDRDQILQVLAPVLSAGNGHP